MADGRRRRRLGARELRCRSQLPSAESAGYIRLPAPELRYRTGATSGAGRAKHFAGRRARRRVVATVSLCTAGRGGSNRDCRKPHTGCGKRDFGGGTGRGDRGTRRASAQPECDRRCPASRRHRSCARARKRRHRRHRKSLQHRSVHELQPGYLWRHAPRCRAAASARGLPAR